MTDDERKKSREMWEAFLKLGHDYVGPLGEIRDPRMPPEPFVVPTSDHSPSVSPDTAGDNPCTYRTGVDLSYDIETLPPDFDARPIVKEMGEEIERKIFRGFADDWTRIYGPPYKAEILYGEGSLGVWPFRIAVDPASGKDYSTISGRYLNRGVEMHSLIDMQLKKNHLDSMLLTADWLSIEMRLLKYLKLVQKKSRGRKRYLKRYHRIGVMTRRKGNPR
jgi:hypothetical protein